MIGVCVASKEGVYEESKGQRGEKEQESENGDEDGAHKIDDKALL